MIVGGVFAFLRFPVPKNEFKRDFVRGFPYRCALSLRGKPPSNGGESLGKKWSGCWWWGGTFLTASIFDWWFSVLVFISSWLNPNHRVSSCWTQGFWKGSTPNKKEQFFSISRVFGFKFPGYLDIYYSQSQGFFHPLLSQGEEHEPNSKLNCSRQVLTQRRESWAHNGRIITGPPWKTMKDPQHRVLRAPSLWRSVCRPIFRVLLRVKRFIKDLCCFFQRLPCEKQDL